MFVWRFEGRKAVLLAIGKRRAPRAVVEESVVRNILLRWVVMARLADRTQPFNMEPLKSPNVPK